MCGLKTKGLFFRALRLNFWWLFLRETNARLRGWQRIPLNSITTTETTAAQWDWKRRALTVPLEAFVSFVAYCFKISFKHLCLKVILRKSITQTHVQHQKLWGWLPKLKMIKVKLATVKSPRQRKPDHSDDAAFYETKLSVWNVQQHWSIEVWWFSATLKPLNFQHVRPNQHQEKTQKPNCAIWTLKFEFSGQLNPDFDDFCFKKLTPA